MFNASFDLDAAVGILSDERNEPWTLLDQLTGLADKSLIQLVDNGRYRLLETIREFAAAKLGDYGDASELADAHLAYFLDVAVDAEPHLLGHDQLRYWARLDPEHDNLTRALQHALTKSDPTEALKLIVSLRNYWSRHGLHTLATEALDAVFARPTSEIDARLYCHAMIERAWHSFRQGLYGAANERAQEAIRAARALDDAAVLALALVTSYYDSVGEPEKSLAHAEEALALARDLGDGYLMSCALHRRAGTLRETDRAESRRCIEQALELDAAAGDQDGVQMALLNLAMLDLDVEDVASARSRAERALVTIATYPNPTFESALLAVLGSAECGEHNFRLARSHFERAFAVARRAGDQSIMAESILGVALTEEGPQDSALLHGAADALLADIGWQLAPTDARIRETDHARVRAVLGDETFAAIYAQGRALTRSEIIALAREFGV